MESAYRHGRIVFGPMDLPEGKLPSKQTATWQRQTMTIIGGCPDCGGAVLIEELDDRVTAVCESTRCKFMQILPYESKKAAKREDVFKRMTDMITANQVVSWLTSRICPQCHGQRVEIEQFDRIHSQVQRCPDCGFESVIPEGMVDEITERIQAS